MNSTIPCQKFPPFSVCSGNGECDTTQGLCKCKEGWSSIGDFAVQDGIDCNINIVVVQALYIIFAIASALAFIYISISLMFQYQLAFASSNYKSFRYFLLEPVRTFQIWAIIFSVGGFISSVYRATRPLAAVGNDIFMTFAHSFLSFCWVNGTSDLCIVIVKFLSLCAQSIPSTAAIRMKEVCLVVLKITPLFRALGILYVFTPMFTLFYPNNSYEIAATYWISFAIWDGVIALFSIIRSIHIMINLIQEHLDSMELIGQSKNQKVAELLKKLKTARTIFINITPGPIIGFLLSGVSPAFSRNSTYLLAYNGITGIIAAVAATYIVSNYPPKLYGALLHLSSKPRMKNERIPEIVSISKVSMTENGVCDQKGIKSVPL